jgi:hypothetical protein
MLPSKLEIFSEISYFALNQMESNSTGSDDERIASDVKDEAENSENDEFSTYFTDQKVEIPEDETVIQFDGDVSSGNCSRLNHHLCVHVIAFHINHHHYLLDYMQIEMLIFIINCLITAWL